MPLNSQAFLLIFLPAAAIAMATSGRDARWRRWCLIAGNAAFYAFAGAAAVAVLALMIALTYVATRMIGADAPGPRRLGLVLLSGNVVVLVWFKVADVAAAGFGIVPLGLSFYTFNLISHGLDVYWQRSPAAPLAALVAYATFFPTISSGPLMRHDDFHRQTTAVQSLSGAIVDRAVLLIAIGLAKKVIVADTLARVIDPLFAAHTQMRLAAAWIAVLGQHLRIYFDFSGYTDLAIGAALLMGIAVPANFNAPYTARSLTEFWQRWHMTLSTWFRDYVFTPLAMWLRSRDPHRRAAPARTIALLTTFVLIGVWHALDWTYVVWGLSQGAILAAHAWLRQRGRPAWPPWAGRFATLGTLLAGWVLLRSTDLRMAGDIYAALLGLRGVETAAPPGVTAWILVAIAVLLVVTATGREMSPLTPPRSWWFAAATAALLAVGILALGQATPFIYLQF